MEIRKVITNQDCLMMRKLLLVTFFLEMLCYGICQGRNDQIPKEANQLAGQAQGVRLNLTDKYVELDNGIVRVTIANPEGFVIGIQYGGLDNVLELPNKESNRGYWDVAGAHSHLANSEETGLIATSYKIIKQTDDQVEISFICPPTPSIQLRVDKRYVMLRGSSGFYSYAIFEREKGWPGLLLDQIRAVYKLKSDKFHFMAVSDKIQRIMPMPQDRVTGQPLAYKEAVLLTNPTNPELKGEVDDKYQYAVENHDNKLHGWISFDPPVGMWLITPSDEFRLGGPLKQDLTSHVGPTLLAMFHSTHFAGMNLAMSFADGEPWKKVFGPYFVHLNSLSGKGSPQLLWQKAKDQLLEEAKSWPYDFPQSEDFLKANQRGSIVGRLLVNDKAKAPIPAASAWVGLAAPGAVGSWQTEMKGYQFWTQTGSDGKFLIENIRPGTYSLYATVPGFIGDFQSASVVVVSPGKPINVGDQVYFPPRYGATLWEIGIPDRTAAEFFVPDPSPKLSNKLFLHDVQDKYRQYGLWDRYTDLYPRNDLIYTVGESDYRKDWFFCQVVRRTNLGYQPTTWQVIFPLKAVVPNGNYTLQVALASAHEAELQIRVNNPDLKAAPLFTTLLIGKDNALARHGIHGIYRLYSVKIPSSLLHSGKNTIFLTQTRNLELFRSVMYDYLRLEGPAS